MTSTIATRVGARLPRRGGRVRTAPYLFSAPFVILFVAFMIVPVVIAVVGSFFTVTRAGLGFGGSGPQLEWVGIGNYVAAIQDEAFVAGFGRMLLFGVVQVPVMLGIALLLALILDSTVIRWKRAAQAVIFLPYAVPVVVAALLWGFLYQPGVSPIVQGLEGLGISVDFLAPGTVLWSIANITTWTYVGFNMVIMYAALQSIGADIFESARIDGASEVAIALRIKVPMIVPTLVLTGLFSIIGTLQLFNEPEVLRTITSNVSSSYTPSMAILQTTTGVNNPNLGAAMAVILGLVTFVLSIAVSRIDRREPRA